LLVAAGAAGLAWSGIWLGGVQAASSEAPASPASARPEPLSRYRRENRRGPRAAHTTPPLQRAPPCPRRETRHPRPATMRRWAPGPQGPSPMLELRGLLNLVRAVETFGWRTQARRDGVAGGPDVGPEPPEPLPGGANGRGGQADDADDPPLDAEDGRRHA